MRQRYYRWLIGVATALVVGIFSACSRSFPDDSMLQLSLYRALVESSDSNASDTGTGHVTIYPTTGLTTSDGGRSDTFFVSLQSAPADDVLVHLSSSDSGEVTLSSSTLTFTPSSWSTGQEVTVTGVDDGIQDGNQAVTIATSVSSNDSRFAALDPDDVAVTNYDLGSVIITPASGLTATEGSSSASFTVELASAPTAPVYVTVSLSQTSRGSLSSSTFFGVSSGELTFTSSSWDTARTITFNPLDDWIAEGSQTINILTDPISSGDFRFNGVDPEDVSLTLYDNDTAGVQISATGSIVTGESASVPAATFTVQLNSDPTSDVTIALSSSNTAEATVAPASITFKPSASCTIDCWNNPQTITVTGVDDALADGAISYTIVTGAASSSDSLYSSMTVNDVSGKNLDDESYAVVFMDEALLLLPKLMTPTRSGWFSVEPPQTTWDSI